MAWHHIDHVYIPRTSTASLDVRCAQYRPLPYLLVDSKTTARSAMNHTRNIGGGQYRRRLVFKCGDDFVTFYLTHITVQKTNYTRHQDQQLTMTNTRYVTEIKLYVKYIMMSQNSTSFIDTPTTKQY